MGFYRGTWRDEFIDGTSRRDVLYGMGGDDRINGHEGSDDLYGGSGFDDINGGAGNDLISGGTGINDMWGGRDADVFRMTGSAFAFSDDWIGDFATGVDRIDVRAWGVSDFSQLQELFWTTAGGHARLNAFFNGYDHFLTINDVSESELSSGDFIYSNSGALRQTGSGSRDVMFGSVEGDRLDGADSRDILLGGFGGDVLIGGNESDELIGGGGDDLLRGGSGGDRLKGDAGNDTFEFRQLSDVNGDFSDFVLDFEQGNDTLDLSGIDARSGLSGNQQFDFIGKAGFSSAGELRFENHNNRTFVEGNIDSDTRAEFTIVLRGVFNLTGGDFDL